MYLQPAIQLIESEVSVKSSARILLAVALLNADSSEPKPLTRYCAESLHKHWFEPPGAATATEAREAIAPTIRENFILMIGLLAGNRSNEWTCCCECGKSDLSSTWYYELG
jgi:hypothetical protein